MFLDLFEKFVQTPLPFSLCCNTPFLTQVDRREKEVCCSYLFNIPQTVGEKNNYSRFP